MRPCGDRKDLSLFLTSAHSLCVGWPARRDQLHKHGCLRRSCVAMLWGWDFWVEGRVDVPLGSMWLQCRPRERPVDSPSGAGRHPPQGPARPTAGSARAGLPCAALGKEGGGGLGWRPGPTAGRAASGQSLDLPRGRVQPRSVEGPPVVVSSGTVGAGRAVRWRQGRFPVETD